MIQSEAEVEVKIMDNFIYKFQVDKALCDDMITYHKNDKYYSSMH